MRRSLATLSGFALALTAAVGQIPAAGAGIAETIEIADGESGRGAVGASKASFASAAKAARAVDRSMALDDPLALPSAYPSQPALRSYPDNVPDATDSNQTISHDDLAKTLTDWMGVSNRISTQVVGQSTAGRDLYLVTLTAPETRAQTAAQESWKQRIKQQPVAAAADPALLAGYKTPVWFSANVHGNEWEGTDASMQVIEDLVNAPWDEVKDLLRGNRLYFSLTLNPDGRTIGQRATALGLDPNRDMITATTPEARSFVRSAQAIQPLYSADLHGYTGVLQVEPCGPPHGENYEYDLFIPHGYAIARQVEDDVVAAAIPGNTYLNTTTGAVVPDNTGPETAHIKIPYRDTPSGWDDYPPIFTAQYAAYFGAVTSTVELPKGRTGPTTTPANAVINTAVAKQTIESMIDYVDTHSDAMLLNQMQIFERGVAGAPKQALTAAAVAAVPGPAEWKPLWDVVDDQDPVVLPRAYVIPVGSTQRSMSDAANVVRHLLFNGVEVGTLDAATTVGGTTYPAGSYVVDLHQPLRGLANTLLDLGTDISLKVPSMYDIAAWSYSYLWGATIDKVGLTTDTPIGATTRINAPTSVGSVPATAGFLAFDVAGVADVQAVNALLDDDVAVSLLDDGTAVVAPEGYDEAATVSDDLDIAFTAATEEDLAALDDPTTKGLEDLTVGYTGAQFSDDMLSLTELGFDLERVTVADLTATPTLLDDVDVLFVGAGLSFANAAPAQATMKSWVDAGHGIVGRGAGGLGAAGLFGLVTATSVAGNGSGNGIVAVDTPADSVLAPFAQDTVFVSPATSFTALGAGTVAAQTYATDPLLAGHWRGTTATNGPEVAAGKASAIAGTAASGAKGFVFGTSPLFRTHPKGGLSQVARALFWAGPAGLEVTAPGTTPPVVTPPAVTPPAVTPPALGPASSTTALKVKRLGNARIKATVTLAVTGLPSTGVVVLKDRGRVIRTIRVAELDGVTSIRVTLGEGRHVLRATYAGTTATLPSASPRIGVRLG